MRLEHKTDYSDLPTLRPPTFEHKQPSSEPQQASILTTKLSDTLTQSGMSETFFKASNDYLPKVPPQVPPKPKMAYFDKIQNEPKNNETTTVYTKFDDMKKPESTITQHQERFSSENYSKTFSSYDSNRPDISYKPEIPIRTEMSQKFEEPNKFQTSYDSPLPTSGVSAFQQVNKSSFLTKPPPPPPPTSFEKIQAPKPSTQLWTSPKPFKTEPLEGQYTSHDQPDSDMTATDNEHIRLQSTKQTREIFEKKILEEQSKTWTPIPTQTPLKSSFLVKQSLPSDHEPSQQSTDIDIPFLRPGTPPEICYAVPPLKEHSQTKVTEKSVEQIQQIVPPAHPPKFIAEKFDKSKVETKTCESKFYPIKSPIFSPINAKSFESTSPASFQSEQHLEKDFKPTFQSTSSMTNETIKKESEFHTVKGKRSLFEQREQNQQQYVKPLPVTTTSPLKSQEKVRKICIVCQLQLKTNLQLIILTIVLLVLPLKF